MIERDEIFIDGRWTPSAGSGQIDVINPTTEEVIGRIPDGVAADVDAAVEAARAAFEGWSGTERAERAALLTRVADLLEERADDLAQIITSELGMPHKLSRIIQVGNPLTTLRSTAELIDEIPWEEEIGNSVVAREPVGVVGAITPWNFPLHQVAAKVAPALAAGCTIVLKPSELTPLCVFAFADILMDAGVPAGVFNLVSGRGVPVGEAIAAHPGIDMVSFTGSGAVGSRVSELAAKNITRVALELGGKSANIVLDDADLEAAVSDGVGKCFLNSGQTCSALTRLLVPHARMDEAEVVAAKAAAKFTPGDPFEKTTRLGPLVSSQQRDRVLSYIRKGIDEGARLVTGSAEPLPGAGYFVAPTVFSGVTNDMTIAREEIFGPVLVIMGYDDEDDAVRIANDSPYGLAGGVWSADTDRALRVAKRLRTGQIEINAGRYNPLAPFGGYKRSGHGREFGRFGIEEFLETKAIQR